MEVYKNFEEFKQNYEKDVKYGIFYETLHVIDVYRKPKNLFEKLFRSKESRRDVNATVCGYSLCPVLSVETLCPMIGKADIKWRGFDGQEYSSRADVKNMYHY